MDDMEFVKRRWRGQWHIWQARRSTGAAGDYYATRLTPAAGPDRTIARPTLQALDAALREQRAAAEDGRPPLDVGTTLRPGE